jgi:hypothetical protein
MHPPKPKLQKNHPAKNIKLTKDFSLDLLLTRNHQVSNPYLRLNLKRRRWKNLSVPKEFLWFCSKNPRREAQQAESV